MSHIFISYSRKDLDFAQKIVDALAANDLDTWIDWKSIPKGEDWEQEIYRGVEAADAFLFLLSPDSVASEMCNKEILHAIKNGKRILPIFIANIENKEVYDVTRKFLREETREEIDRRNFIFCRDEGDNFSKAIEEIQTTIQTDYEWLKYHTRLQVKALEWERTKDASRLLRGKELREAEQKLAYAESQKDPQPTPTQRQYILNSEKNELRIRRQVTFGLVAGLAIMLVLSIVAWQQRNIARDQANVARAGELAALALVHASEKPDLAFLLGVEGFRHLDSSSTRNSLITLLQTNPRLLAHLKGQARFAFSPTGSMLATSDLDSIYLWKISNSDTLVKLGSISMDDGNTIFALGFSPDGKILASGDVNGDIVFVDVTDPEKPVQIGLTLSAHKDIVTSLAFNPNGRVLASGSADQTISLWDVSRPDVPGQLGSFLADYTDQVNYVEFSPDGNVLASGGLDGNVILWDVSKPTIPNKLGVILSSGVYGVAFSPDGNVLAADNYYANSISLWDISHPDVPVQIGQPLVGRKNITKSQYFDFVTSVAFSPNGKMVAVGSLDHSLVLWDVSNPEIPLQINQALMGHTSIVLALEFSSDSNLLASSDGYSTILWDVSSFALPSVPSFSTIGYTSGITTAAYDLSGKMLALGSEKGSISFLDISNPANPVAISTIQAGPSSKTVHISFLQDNKILASVERNDMIELWDLSDLNAPFPFENTLAGTFLNISPDGKILASVSKDGTFTLWDISDPSQSIDFHSQFAEFPKWISSLAFSPDGRSMATGSDSIILWDISIPSRPVQLSSPFSHYPSGVGSLTFSSDGKILASGSYNLSIALWDVSDPTMPIQIGESLTSHSGPVLALTFSPPLAGNASSKILVSGSSDNTIILWDVFKPDAPVQIGFPLTGLEMGVSSLVFSSDGKTLVSSGWDGNSILWDLDPNSWAARACQKAGRNFTKIEWKQYFPDEAYHLTCSQWPAEE